MAQQNSDETPESRAELRTGLYYSKNQYGEPCKSIWIFDLPGKRGDDGIVQRVDFCEGWSRNFGHIENLTGPEGLKMLAEFEAGLARGGKRVKEETSAESGSPFLKRMTQEAWWEKAAAMAVRSCAPPPGNKLSAAFQALSRKTGVADTIKAVRAKLRPSAARV